jgi:hypothetical protein
MPEAMPFPAPDYELMESLVQKLLDQIGAANIMIAAGEDDAAILVVLRAAQAAHQRLVQAMDRDALNAHAAGHIFTVLLGERLEVLRQLTIDMRNTRTAGGTPVAGSRR